MARLDRLGGAKDIAQTAAVIGRQFPHDLLATVAEAGDKELREGLERLRESGLIFAAGAEEEPAYSFNHALIQEAAYESLSRARRQALHAKIARALESGGAAGGAASLRSSRITTAAPGSSRRRFISGCSSPTGPSSAWRSS